MADKIFFKTGLASSLPTTKTAGQLLFAIDGTSGSIYLDKDSKTRIKFNADAVKLATPRSINGTSFDGSSDITTANWGTARNISISDATGANTGTAVSVNGSKAVILKLPATIVATLKGNADTATKATTADSATTATTCTGNAATATKLKTGVAINGTNFDGSSAITTANWGTARNITIGGTKKLVNGSQAYSWTLNEIGALPGKTISAATAAAEGWYRIATTASSINNNLGQFTIQANPSGRHCLAIINAGVSYGYTDGINLQQISYVKYANNPILTKARIVYNSTYSGNYAHLEVYVSSATATTISVQFNGFGWTLVAPNTAGSVPSGYTTKEITFVPNSIVSNLSGKATSAGTADSAAKLTTPRAINGTNFDGSGAITTANWGTARDITIVSSDGTGAGAAVSVNGSGNVSLKLPATIKANLTGKATSAGTADSATTATTATTCTGNAATATTLKTARSINGTLFNGSADITTSKWGTSRNISIGNSDGTGAGTAVAVDGSGNVTLKLPSTITANLSGNATTATTATTTTGNAGTATKLKTARKINGTSFDGSADITTTNWGTARTVSISSAAGTSGTSVNGSSNVALIVPKTMTGFSSITSTKFIGALGESYLIWGGKNFAGSYGPLDAAMIPDLGANRLAFAAAAGIKVEYSTNGGSTWVDYGATDAEKKKIFAQGGALVCGKNSDKTADLSKMMLRITLDTDKVPVYTVLNKFAIYVSTDGASGCYCTIDASLESTPTTFVTFADKVSITGWSGWNIINTNSLTTFGNTASAHYGIVRFTFGCTGRGTSNYSGLRIQRIMGFGGVGWTTPSNMARYGTIYSYDESQNVNFPAQVTATKFNGVASKATVLETARSINGTSFNGSANIVTTQWGTARNITIKDGSGNKGTSVSVDGSANVELILPATIAATVSAANKLTVNAGDSNTPVYFEGGVPKAVTSIDVKSDRAAKLDPGAKINGTTFTGETDITTSNWGTARNFTIGNTTKSVNGSAAMSWTLAEIGAVNKAGDTMTGHLTGKALNSSWIGTTRKGAFRTEAAASGGSAVAALSMKTSSGAWSISNVTGSNNLYFVFGTDENYDAGTNTTANYYITSSGAFSGSAATLTTARSINGTSFNGSSDITTSKWGTARILSISSTAGTTGTSINGSANASLIVPSTMTGFSSITSTKLIATTVASDTGHIVFPDGGQYTTTDSTKTGYLKITLPVSWTNAMMRFYVDIYNYSTGTSATYMIGGYNYASNSAWQNVYAQAIGVPGSKLGNLSVRFGHDGSKCAIYIGAADTSWNYPQVMIRDLYVGFTQDEKNYTTGWSIDFTTTLGTISQTVENTNVAYKLYAARTINGTSFDGSSNITTANWGTSRNITIKDSSGNKGTAVAVNGGSNVELILPTTIAATVSAANKLTVNAGDSNTPVYFEGGVPKAVTSIDVKSDKAAKLDPGAKINGTTFTGASDITTSNWGTSRTLTIGNTGKSVNGSGNVSWTIAEIGALALTGGTITGKTYINTASGTNPFYITRTSGTSESTAFWQDDSQLHLDVTNDETTAGISFKLSATDTENSDGSKASSGTITFSMTSGATTITANNFAGKATSATKLATARTINGTSFDGSGNITTANWGTARNIYIQDSDGSNTGAAVSVNGGANATLKLPSTIKANLSGNATSVGNGAMKLYAHNNNEINFGGANGSATIYFSYRATDSKPITSTFVFGGSTGTATLKAASFTGNAATASKLATARSIALAGDVTGSTSFDGSSNVSLTATVANDSHNHSYSTISLKGSYVSNTSYTSLPDGITYIEMPSTATVTGDPAYGAMLTVKYGGGRAFQVVGNSSNKLYFRGMHSGLSSAAGTGYGAWRAVALSDGGTYTMNITGNASGTAGKLATARNITISGTASSSIGTFDGSANTTIYMPLTISGFNEIKTKKLTITNTSSGAHIAFSRGSWNYFTAPTSGSFAFSPNGRETTAAGAVAVIDSTGIIPGNSNNTFNLGSSSYKWKNVYATTFTGALSGNATTASTLQTARSINGTSFNGSSDITTTKWGTARTLTIGNTGKSVNGSGNVSWTIAEIGASDTKLLRNNYVSFTVGGDADTYYPVLIDSGHGSLFGWEIVSISRYYSATAPDTWNNATHKGALTLTLRWSGDTSWGGNDKTIVVEEFNEQYSTMVGGLELSVNGLIVWLRGGGAIYNLTTPYGKAATASVKLTDYTASDKKVYSARTYNADTVNTEVKGKWYLRSNKFYGSASKLMTARTINGTSFDGSGNITTSYWGTERTISISSAAGTTGTKINGNADKSLVIPSTMTGFASITSTTFVGNLSGKATSAGTADSATFATRTQYLESTKKHYANSIYTSGRGNRFCIRQYVNTSSSSTSPTDCTYYEQYNLPIPSAGRSSNVSYTILTSKNKVTVSQGGTGTGSTGAGSGQALYNLGLVYSATEPASPTTGMVWLKPA